MKKNSGFTLIEMLVVVLIVGLFAGLASAILRPDERILLRDEAERLAQLLDLAALEARYSGVPVAWTSDGKGYRFWRFQENDGWSELRDNEPLRARALPQGIVLSGLRIENAQARNILRLEFTPYGMMRAWRIGMTLGGQHYRIEASPLGELRVAPGLGEG